jgi:hypothetical protein
MDAKLHLYLLQNGERKDILDVLEKEEVCPYDLV